MYPDYFIGLDLGQTTDYTALAVIERQAQPPSTTDSECYALRHLRRFPLGTPYTTIVPSVTELVHALPRSGSARLVVDHTGVGRPVVEVLQRTSMPASLSPITITGGHTVVDGKDGSQHVPKKDLVTCLLMLIQSRRLKIARALPEAELLVQEMNTFRIKITAAANENYGAQGAGQHDDLVMAVALACWVAERCPRWIVSADHMVPDSLIARAPKGVFLTTWEEDEKAGKGLIANAPPGVFLS